MAGRAGGGKMEQEWAHLMRYGYAPGHYMNTCLQCGQTVVDVDKRATCCRACAEARHAYSKPPCQQCGAMTEDEATSRCMGRAAGDGCHGTDLWPG
jgi:hypothetical protein